MCCAHSADDFLVHSATISDCGSCDYALCINYQDGFPLELNLCSLEPLLQSTYWVAFVSVSIDLHINQEWVAFVVDSACGYLEGFNCRHK